MRRFLLAAATVVAASLPLAADPIGVGLDVSPAKLEIQIPPGQSYNLPITVHNAGFEATHIQVTMVDFGVNQQGSYQFSNVGTNEYSLLKHATIRPREFDLAPNTIQQVQLTLSMPNDSKLSGEYAGIVFFQTRPVRRGGTGVVFSARIASKIYETVPGTSRIDGAIQKMSSDKGAGKQVYRVSFKNTGNTHEYLNGTLQVQRNGATVESIQLPPEMLVERGGTRVIEVSGKALQPGQYQAITTIDYGGKSETGGEISFDVR